MSEHAKKYNSQEDPFVMYLVVHEIGMSTGKIAAQVGHAVDILHNKRNEFLKSNSIFAGDRLKNWKDWQDDSFHRKIVLTANDSKWNKLKIQLADFGIDYSLVIDAGLTEIPSGSETVIGIWPMRKSSSPIILKKLQVLK
jgi:peptidyl-tRNA hydrolase, PTH2 family